MSRLRRSTEIVFATTFILGACSLSQQHGYAQSDDGTLVVSLSRRLAGCRSRTSGFGVGDRDRWCGPTEPQQWQRSRERGSVRGRPGLRTPLIDGRIYATEEMRDEMNAYHELAAAAHRKHGKVEAALPALRLAPPAAEPTDVIDVADRPPPDTSSL